MFRGKPQIRAGLAKISFEPHDLKGVDIDPSAPFELNWVHVPAHTVLADTAFLVLLLAEINLPGKGPMSAAQALALHVKIGNQPGMKDQHDRRKTSAGHLVGKHVVTRTAITVFLHVKKFTKLVFYLADGRQIIKREILKTISIAGAIDVLVMQDFCRGIAIDQRRQIRHPYRGLSQDIVERARDAWFHRRNSIVNIGR